MMDAGGRVERWGRRVGLAHDLRNPLAGISGALHVLGSRLAPEDDRAALLADVQSQISRMNRTLTGLLQQSSQFLPPVNIQIVRRLDGLLPAVYVDLNLLTGPVSTSS